MTDPVLTIERVRNHSKDLWRELAFLLHYEWKTERKHNDIILQMLRDATKKGAPSGVKHLLTQISLNDRTVSDLTRKIADACDGE